MLNKSDDDKDAVEAYAEHVAGYILKSDAGTDFPNPIQILEKFVISVHFPTDEPKQPGLPTRLLQFDRCSVDSVFYGNIKNREANFANFTNFVDVGEDFCSQILVVAGVGSLLELHDAVCESMKMDGDRATVESVTAGVLERIEELKDVIS